MVPVTKLVSQLMDESGAGGKTVSVGIKRAAMPCVLRSCLRLKCVILSSMTPEERMDKLDAELKEEEVAMEELQSNVAESKQAVEELKESLENLEEVTRKVEEENG